MDTESGMRVLCDAIAIGSNHLTSTTSPVTNTTRAFSSDFSSLPSTADSPQISGATPNHAVSDPFPPDLQRSAPIHLCRLCNRIYERADHLNRHLKSHENARPFKCDQCAKSFNRADLLSRHRASHERQPKGPARIERADRAAAACAGCVSAKAKCQDQKPCARCIKKGMACEMNRNDVARTDPAHLAIISQRGPMEQHLNPLPNELSSARSEHYVSNVYNSTLAKEIRLEPQLDYSQSVQIQNDSGLPATVVYDETNIPFEDTFNTFSFLDGVPTFQDSTFIPGNFSQDVDFNLWDMDLESVELEYQNIGSTPGDTDYQHQERKERQVPREISKRFAAFERSPWLFKPTPNDHALNDQENLALDEDNIPSVLSPSSPAATLAEFASCCINSKIRDQMLSVLFSIRRNPGQLPSFPSLALLNNIIQVFFVQESYQVGSLIHVGTFDPLKMLPQLLISIVSAGSTLISMPVIWKMGLALQEVVRHAVTELWEKNNSTIRNLQALQSFMICLDIGLWSGFKRQMEIAESFAQPIVIMLRRSGAFGAQRSPSVTPAQSDPRKLLESKWKKWAEIESYKRLIIHLFIHDVNASIGMQKPPLIYLTELKFPLPAARELWLAKTAEEWRELYHSRPPPPSDMPDFIAAMQNPALLESIAEHIDLHLCALTLLHGFWGQIWACHESKRFYPESKSAHRLCLMTEHRELYRDLSEFAARIPSLTRNSPEATLLAELFMMILHASPDELQRFAGKYGEDEAKLAATGFRTWRQTADSRIAIWHGGQVFRAAKRLKPARLRGFNAIAVYYASLTLWIYGLMSSSSSLTGSLSKQTSSLLSSSIISNQRPIMRILLNESETAKSRIFVSNDEGVPGLAVVQEGDAHFIPLEATDRVLGFARDVYRSNFPVLDQPLPPLVENLGNLLRDLSSLPGSRVSRAGSEMGEAPT